MRSIRRPGRTITWRRAPSSRSSCSPCRAGARRRVVDHDRNGDAVVRFQDYTLAQGQTVNSVVVIRGNAVIGGTVTRSVVVVGGDATIESTAVVGADQTRADSSVVVVGGHLTAEPGATIHGKTTQVTGFHLGGVLRTARRAWSCGRSASSPAGGSSCSCRSWRWSCRRSSPGPSDGSASVCACGSGRRSGWGLLGLLVVGRAAGRPRHHDRGAYRGRAGGHRLPAVLLFCFVGVAALLGRLVLSSSERYRDNIVVAAVVGAALVRLVSLVPVVGGLASSSPPPPASAPRSLS